jgi:hypothetical protein
MYRRQRKNSIFIKPIFISRSYISIIYLSMIFCICLCRIIYCRKVFIFLHFCKISTIIIITWNSLQTGLKSRESYGMSLHKKSIQLVSFRECFSFEKIFCFSFLKGHGNEADFLGFLQKLVPHRSLTLPFEPFWFWLQIRGDIRNRKTTPRLADSPIRRVRESAFECLKENSASRRVAIQIFIAVQ